jgi:crotonobetainyl-CoA:carnitine CoA-transferase CaiB-like acyl-CoA transferase
MRPSALSRLDLHRLSETHPALVHVEIVGHDGDAAELPGHDLTYQAAHGTLCPPAMPLAPVADLLGAERAVSAAVSGLLSRTRVGRGGHYKIVLDHAARMAGAAVRHGLMGLQRLWGGGSVTHLPHISHFGWLCRSRCARAPLRRPGFRAYRSYD